jgi:hypothetical protein
MSLPLSSQSESLEVILTDLDPLLIAVGLAFAACMPGPAGEAGAVAAILFDVKQRRWWGVVLSAVSMVPVVGYLPAILKIVWLLWLLNRRLKTLEDMLPALHQSPEDVEALRNALEKYYRRLPRVRLTRSLRARLERIMALDESDLTADAKAPGDQPALSSDTQGDPK